MHDDIKRGGAVNPAQADPTRRTVLNAFAASLLVAIVHTIV